MSLTKILTHVKLLMKKIGPILQMGILDYSVNRKSLGVKRDELIHTCTEFKILS